MFIVLKFFFYSYYGKKIGIILKLEEGISIICTTQINTCLIAETANDLKALVMKNKEQWKEWN